MAKDIKDILDKMAADQEKALVASIMQSIHRLSDTISITVLIVFVVLKLTDVIAWSWIWVLSPYWIALIFNIIVLFVVKYVVHKKLNK